MLYSKKFAHSVTSHSAKFLFCVKHSNSTLILSTLAKIRIACPSCCFKLKKGQDVIVKQEDNFVLSCTSDAYYEFCSEVLVVHFVIMSGKEAFGTLHKLPVKV